MVSVPGHALRCGPETSVTSPLRRRWVYSYIDQRNWPYSQASVRRECLSMSALAIMREASANMDWRCDRPDSQAHRQLDFRNIPIHTEAGYRRMSDYVPLSADQTTRMDLRGEARLGSKSSFVVGCQWCEGPEVEAPNLSIGWAQSAAAYCYTFSERRLQWCALQG